MVSMIYNKSRTLHCIMPLLVKLNLTCGPNRSLLQGHQRTVMHGAKFRVLGVLGVSSTTWAASPIHNSYCFWLGFFFIWGPHLAVHRDHSSRDHIRCQGLNLDQSCKANVLPAIATNAITLAPGIVSESSCIWPKHDCLYSLACAHMHTHTTYLHSQRSYNLGIRFHLIQLFWMRIHSDTFRSLFQPDQVREAKAESEA